MKKITLSYLAGYLLGGGLGLAFFPDFTLRLMQATGEYGDLMPRVAGMIMIGLGGLIAQFVYNEQYQYYYYSVYIRTFFVAFIFWLYAKSDDPFFLVLNGIILVGLLPSIFMMAKEKMQKNAEPA